MTHGRELSINAALSCLFAALCCAGALISIPIPLGPVPIALSNLFAVLGGLLLGPLWGAASALAYVAVGALGFPVFSGGRGGIAHLAGPTAGYLVGYVLGAFAAGLLARKRGVFGSALGSALGSASGFAIILLLGSGGLALINGLPWGKAAAIGILPFLPGDAIKAVLAAMIALRLGPLADSLRNRRFQS
jgi:biotin transport system substrate-specific component